MVLRFGLYADARLDLGPVAQAAEAAGFGNLWVYDSPVVFGDAWLACLVALQQTTRIVVGPGVANPRQQIAPHTAQRVATLARAAPGRVALGLGVGNSARRALGQRPARLDELADHIRVVRALLRGQEVAYSEAGRSALVRFLHPDGPWIDLSQPVAIWLSAFGPRSQRLAARSGDGVLVRWEGPETFERVRAAVRTDAARAGRDPDSVALGVVSAVYPLAVGEDLDSPTARAALGPLVVSRLRYLTATLDRLEDAPEPFRAGFVAYRRYQETLPVERRHLDNYLGYLVFTPPELESFVTPAAMAAVARVGPPAAVAAEVEAMAAAGVDQVTLQVAGDQADFCRRMAASVFPLLTERAKPALQAAPR